MNDIVIERKIVPKHFDLILNSLKILKKEIFPIYLFYRKRSNTLYLTKGSKIFLTSLKISVYIRKIGWQAQ